MRHDNKGMSLVELILAMTMATIVMGAAMLFLRTALNTYTLADAHIDVQKEAQMNLEQIGTWLMEGNRIGAGSISIVSGDTVVTAHSVTDNTASESILVVFDEPRSEFAGDYSASILSGVGTSGLEYADCDTDVKVFWLGSSGKLYMLHMFSNTDYSSGSAVVTVSGSSVSGNSHAAFDVSQFGNDGKKLVDFMKKASNYKPANLADYEDDDHLLAEYVTDFNATLTNAVDANNNITGASVNLSMTYEEDRVKYTISNQYSMRNVLR